MPEDRWEGGFAVYSASQKHIITIDNQELDCIHVLKITHEVYVYL